jgi:hypothetical protein
MTKHEASRTLVKSPPELWAECSDAASLARHLGQFGEIRITKLEPETAVAWEGEHVSGTVKLEPSGWGTKVILTARATGQEAQSSPAVSEPAVPEPASDAPSERLSEAPSEPRAVPDEALGPPSSAVPPPVVRGHRFGRLFGFMRRAPEPVESEDRAVAARAVVADRAVAENALPEDPVAREDAGPELIDTPAVLGSALESLGQAHHRPFSRG